MDCVFFYREIRFIVRPAHRGERSWAAQLADGLTLLGTVEQVGLEDTLVTAIRDAQDAINEWIDGSGSSALGSVNSNERACV